MEWKEQRGDKTPNSGFAFWMMKRDNVDQVDLYKVGPESIKNWIGLGLDSPIKGPFGEPLAQQYMK